MLFSITTFKITRDGYEVGSRSTVPRAEQAQSSWVENDANHTMKGKADVWSESLSGQGILKYKHHYMWRNDN